MLPGTYVMPVFAGWLLAVIINYLADTLPVLRKLSIVRCPQCKTEKSIYYYFIPLRCRNCGEPAKKRHILILLLSVFLCVLISFYRPGDLWLNITNWLVTGYLLLIIVIDIEHHLVLHPVAIAGAIIFSIFGCIAHSYSITILGGLAGFIVMLAIFSIGHFYSTYKAKKIGSDVEDALGFGDVTFGGVCGLLVGWPNIIPALVFAVVMGGVWSLLLIAINMLRNRGDISNVFIAYAPFFAISTGFIWLVLH